MKYRIVQRYHYGYIGYHVQHEEKHFFGRNEWVDSDHFEFETIDDAIKQAKRLSSPVVWESGVTITNNEEK